jgi:hypothetical protein
MEEVFGSELPLDGAQAAVQGEYNLDQLSWRCVELKSWPLSRQRSKGATILYEHY